MNALIFSGQGAQYEGMGKDLYDNFAVAKEICDIGDEITGGLMSKVAFNGSLEELSKTKNTQPCMFIHQAMCLSVLKEKGISYDGVAGFSLGEYGAIYGSGALSFEDCLKLVIARGQFMEEATAKNKGAMAAIIGLLDEEVIEISKKSDVYPVNFNCDKQLVIAGSEENIDKAITLFETTKARVKKLNVSGAFHSPFMEEASHKLEEYLKDVEIKEPNCEIYSNVTSNIMGDIKENMVKQVKNPVLWKQSMENMIKKGYNVFYDLGAGKTLSSFMRKIDKSVTTINVDNLKSIEEL